MIIAQVKVDVEEVADKMARRLTIDEIDKIVRAVHETNWKHLVGAAVVRSGLAHRVVVKGG